MHICIYALKNIHNYIYIYTYVHMIAYVFACSTHVSFGCPETEFCVSRMVQLSHHGVTPRSRHQTCSVGIDAWPSRAVPFSEDHEKKPKNYSNYSEDSEGISHQDIHFR